jgi:hypothetical protein
MRASPAPARPSTGAPDRSCSSFNAIGSTDVPVAAPYPPLMRRFVGAAGGVAVPDVG